MTFNVPKVTLTFIHCLLGNVAYENDDYCIECFRTSLSSILVIWFECRFLVTEVDGSNPGNSMLFP